MRSPFVILASFLVSGNLAAQPSGPARQGAFAVGVTVGGAAFGTAALGRSDEGDAVEFAPYHPTMWGVRVDYGRERVRLALSAELGSAGLMIRGSSGEPAGFLLVSPGALHLASLRTSLSIPLMQLESGPVVRALAGLRIERWTARGTSARCLAGPFGGVAVEIGLWKRFAATIEGELGMTPKSPFRADDLPEQVSPRATWRRSAALSVSWRP